MRLLSFIIGQVYHPVLTFVKYNYPCMSAAYKLVLANKKSLLFAFLALLGDVWALLTYTPYSVASSCWLIFFFLLTFIAELALFYSNFFVLEGKPESLLDSWMTGVAFMPNLLLARVIISILPASAIAVALISTPIIENSPSGLFLNILLITAALLFSQLVTFFTCAEVLIRDIPAGEAISRGINLVWTHKKHLAVRMLPFILVDLVLLGALFSSGAITHDSMFIWRVTPEMARAARFAGLDNPRLTRAGDYFVMNRPEQAYLLTLLKDRGAELLSLAYPMTANIPIGLAAILVSYPLLLLRMAVLTRCYREFIHPPQTT